MRFKRHSKSNEIWSVLRNKFVYCVLFVFLNVAGYYARFIDVNVRTKSSDEDSVTEKKGFIRSMVNNIVGPRITINSANAKILEKETSRNETEYEKIKTFETPVEILSGIGEAHSDSHSDNKASPKINPEQNRTYVGAVEREIPRFLFGHSTGHSGSTFTQQILKKPGCPWVRRSRFEDASSTEVTVDYPKCDNTVNHIAPRIRASIGNPRYTNTTYIDMGHFHNRGRTIECLADYFREDAAFVHIRRNRYDIAHSFSQQFQTPCIENKKGLRNPMVSTCPRSDENIGSVNLPVDDEIWDALTPFQRFLWYVDEMEHRWHTLKAAHKDRLNGSKGNHASPMFFELTWSSPVQLSEETNRLRRTLGCTTVKTEQVAKKKHVKHENGTKICALNIQQDYEYRRLMNYDNITLQILVSSRFPQHVDSEECMESPEQIKKLTRVHAAEQGMRYDEDTWVFPPEEGRGKSVG